MSPRGPHAQALVSDALRRQLALLQFDELRQPVAPFAEGAAYGAEHG